MAMLTKHDSKKTVQNPIFITIKDENGNLNISKNETKNYVLNFKEHQTNYNIKIAENSHIKLLILSYGLNEANINLNIEVSRFASVNLIAGFLNKKTNINSKIYLNEEGANANVNSLLISNENDNQSAYYEIINNAPHTNGNIDVIGIASDKSRVKVDGIGQINEGMHQSNNFQHLTGIISDDATIEMNPYLLIDEHDVIAGHGATVGQIDEEVIYYMMSRGIPEEKARLIYIEGLIAPFVNEIFDKDLCESFNQQIWGEKEWMLLK